MRKTLPYLLLLILLGVGVWYFLRRPEGESFDPDEAGFTVSDTAAIHRIFLASRTGSRVTLERTPQGWMLDGKYPALRANVRQLLTTLYKQKAAYPVPKGSHNFIVKGMAGGSVKVELFGKDGRPLRTFYVGAETPDFDGTYMLMEGAERPYVVKMSGFEGYLQPRYATSWYDWRDRTVFDVPAAAIQRASVKYAEDPHQSFAISRTPEGIAVEMDGPAPGPANVRRAEQYLSFFQNVNSEGYFNGKRDVRESIATTAKKCDIELQTTGGTQRVAVYWEPVNQRSKNVGGELYDPDRYYAIINGGADTVGIQQQAFEKIFRDGREFFAADTVAKR